MDKRRNVKKALRITLIAVAAWFLSSWAVAAVSLRSGFGRADRAALPEQFVTEYACEEGSFYSGANRLYDKIYPVRAGSDEKGLIVMVHGLGGNMDSHLPVALKFTESGYKVFTFDCTGSGCSEGWGVRGLSQGALDLDAALTYIASDPELQSMPLIVYGHSMGGYAAAAVTAKHPEVDGIISIAAFDRPLTEMMEMAKKKAGVIAYAGYPGLAMQYLLMFGPDGNRSAAKALSGSKVPALIIAGSNDQVVPYPVSLYAKKDAIDDPNAEFIMIDEPYRNGHVGLWRSKKANREHTEELDEGFMQEILAFADAVVQKDAEEK